MAQLPVSGKQKKKGETIKTQKNQNGECLLSGCKQTNLEPIRLLSTFRGCSMLLTLKLFSGGNLNVFECFFPPLLSVDFLRPDSLMFKTRILSYFFFGSFSLSLFFSWIHLHRLFNRVHCVGTVGSPSRCRPSFIFFFFLCPDFLLIEATAAAGRLLGSAFVSDV